MRLVVKLRGVFCINVRVIAYFVYALIVTLNLVEILAPSASGQASLCYGQFHFKLRPFNKANREVCIQLCILGFLLQLG